MFHKSELQEYAHKFPQDQMGYVPTQGDCWRQMKFDHAHQDPHEEGISEDEQARRIEYLDKVWWPQVLEQVAENRQQLEEAHGDSFIQHWERVVNKAPEEPHGFEVE
ncbi:MAG: hypothetical protein GTO62_19480 [Planctomycetales bacterium]|nr:hypothetical protein [Planctomycetales bacterium]